MTLRTCAITLVGAAPPSDPDQSIIQLIDTYGGVFLSENTLAPDYATDYICELPEGALKPLQHALRMVAQRWDVAVQPMEHRRKKLLLADMDSTIVAEETLDAVAEKAGVGDQVAAITARAMLGELDFEQALHARLELLAGVSIGVFDEVAQHMPLSAGADTLLNTLKANGVRCVLVSGGFDRITARISANLGFDHHLANRLELDDRHCLTGKLIPPIIDQAQKARLLQDEASGLSLSLAETCAIGDGANDLAMVSHAGLGVAYQGKKILRDAADAHIDKTDLRSLLYFQGYTEAELS